MLKSKKGILILVTFVILCGIGYVIKFNSIKDIAVDQTDIVIQKQESTQPITTANVTPPTEETISVTVQETLKQMYKIYVCGEVNHPAVVTIDSGSRIIDALELAGGATAAADLNQINLAQYVSDAQKIYIPKIGEQVDKNEIIAQNSSVRQNNVDNTLININTATSSELEQLPGIGPAIAQGIIDYRVSKGSFKDIDEIKNVSRIGDKTFDKIKDKITVGN